MLMLSIFTVLKLLTVLLQHNIKISVNNATKLFNDTIYKSELDNLDTSKYLTLIVTEKAYLVNQMNGNC